MKKILNFTKKIYVLIILSLLFSHILPISEIKAEEDYDYYLDFRSSGSGFIFSDKENIADGGKYGFMNIKGEVVVGLKYDDMTTFEDGLAYARRGEKYGYLDKEGREVVPFKYSDLGDFHEGLAYACRNGKYGYVDKKGNEVIPFKFDGADDFKYGYGRVNIRDKYGKVKKIGYVNKKGKVTYIKNLQKYIAFSYMSEGLIAVTKEKEYKWGYINKKGKVVIPLKYDYVEDFHEGLAAVKVKKGGKSGYINKKGKVVIPLKYGYARDFHEGLAAVEKGGKSGYINKKGKVVIPFKYFNATSFSGGLAQVDNLGSSIWTTINKKGIAIAQYSEPNKVDDKFVFINKKGKKIVLTDYLSIEPFSEGLAFALNKNGKWGYIDENGNPVTEFEYDDVDASAAYQFDTRFHDGGVLVRKGDKYGAINKEGKVVIPIEYGYSGR